MASCGAGCSSPTANTASTNGIALGKLFLHYVLQLAITIQYSLGLLKCAVSSLLEDKSFGLDTAPAKAATEIAMQFSSWLDMNQEICEKFSAKMITMMDACIVRKRASDALNRKHMWSSYHALRVSNIYIESWKHILLAAGITENNPTFFQFVGNEMFQSLVSIRWTSKQQPQQHTAPPHLTYKDTNALRYLAGYIPRMLRKRLCTSTHPLREDILLCIYDLLDDGDENYDPSQDWIQAVDRGGLTKVNNATFDVFLAIENELNKRFGEDLTDEVKKEIAISEEVDFFWSVVCGDWEQESSQVLLQMIVNQYVKIRGFSNVSKCVEDFKAANKKTTQKSKGIRKQLISQPSNNPPSEEHDEASENNVMETAFPSKDGQN